jgi:hypothetical protein
LGQGYGEVVLRLGRVGLEADRAAETIQGLIELAQLGEGNA